MDRPVYGLDVRVPCDHLGWPKADCDRCDVEGMTDEHLTFRGPRGVRQYVDACTEHGLAPVLDDDDRELLAEVDANDARSLRREAAAGAWWS